MARFYRKRSQNVGLTPGTGKFVGDQKVEETSIAVIDFAPDQYEKFDAVDLKDLSRFKETESTSWISVTGLHDVAVIKTIGEIFELHPLLIEDVLNTTQRPKLEVHGKYLFIVIKMLSFSIEKNIIESEQLSLIVGKNLLISFQEVEQPIFQPIRNRITVAKSKIQQRKSDYLAYTLLDAIVDNYILIIERIGEIIEDLEDQLITNPSKEHLEEINYNKREMNYLRKTVRPVRELCFKFRKVESNLFHSDTSPFIDDLQDHITQVVEAIEVYQEMLKDQLNTYNSTLTNKLNDIMRVLTIYSVIFIPLTFLAGIYGTNFEYFPELGFKYAYPIFWFILAIVALSMVIYFKRKKWL